MTYWFKKASLSGTVAILLLVTIVAASNPIFVSANSEEIEELIEKIKNAPEYDLKIREFKNSPIKILDAKVKEISKEDFEKLTGRTSEKEIIVSAPKTKIQNTSNKTIKEVWLAVWDFPEIGGAGIKGRGIKLSNLSIAPGETYSVLRERFVRIKPVIETDEKGNLKEFTTPFVQSRRFWFPHYEKTQLRIFVQSVTFEDGTNWSSYNSKKSEG